MEKARRLRELIRRPRITIFPGAATAMTAKLVESAGFEAVYMTGYGTALNLLGLPDMGLATMSEVVLNAGYMAQAVNIPLLADADTGYGNAVNVRRTVQSFIRAGVAGIHLEDQVSPKRCGGVAGREVIGIDEMVGKLRAAIDARAEADPDFVIIARTDALGAANGGLEETLRRGKAYIEAGADAVMIAEAAVDSLERIRLISGSIGGPFVCTCGHFDPAPDHEDMERAGLAGAIYPREGWKFGLVESAQFLRALRSDADAALRKYSDKFAGHALGNMSGLHELAGFPEWLARIDQYAASPGELAGTGWRPRPKG